MHLQHAAATSSGPGMVLHPGMPSISNPTRSPNLSAEQSNTFLHTPFSMPLIPQIIVSQPPQAGTLLQLRQGDSEQVGTLVSQPSGSALQDTTAMVVNTTASERPGKQTRKRKNQSTTPAVAGSAQISNAQKRRKKNTRAPEVPAEAATICGVGPTSPGISSSADPGVQPPCLNVDSVGASERQRITKAPRDSKNSATDVWYFLWAVDSVGKPEAMPEDQPRLSHRPDSDFVACRLCG